MSPKAAKVISGSYTFFLGGDLKYLISEKVLASSSPTL
jgi:hypothetical protein